MDICDFCKIIFHNECDCADCSFTDDCIGCPMMEFCDSECIFDSNDRVDCSEIPVYNYT